MGKVRWTEKASSHLQAIFEYIAGDSPTYASRFIRSLIKATSRLEAMPRCGRIVPELGSSQLREVIYRNYRIVYRVVERDDIEILAVIHSAREIKATSREEWEL